MGFSNAFLCIVHTVTGAIGAAILASSIVLLVRGDEYLPSDPGAASWYAWVPFTLGLLIVLLAILGCWCSTDGNAVFLAIYAILQFVFGSMIIIAGSFVVVSTDRYLTNIINADSISNGLDEGVGGAQQDFSDFMLGLFSGCCNSTIPSCAGSPLVQGDKSYCYLDLDSYEDGLESGENSQNSYCDIKDIRDSCSSGLVDDFLRANDEFLKDNIYPGGVALITFGVLLFLASFFSCYVGSKDPKRKKSDHYHHEKPAGEYAYGRAKQGDAISYA